MKKLYVKPVTETVDVEAESPVLTASNDLLLLNPDTDLIESIGVGGDLVPTLPDLSIL